MTAQHSSIPVSSRVGKFSYAIRNIVVEAQRVEAAGTRVRYLNIGDPIPFGFHTPPHLIALIQVCTGVLLLAPFANLGGRLTPDQAKHAFHVDSLATMLAALQIAGPSLLELHTWRWIYANPKATPEQLRDNLGALLDALNKSRPASTKGIFLKKVSVSSTMGLGVKVDPATLSAQAQ